ncbi:melanoma-associated antigen B4-like isoform X1 [Canis lupus familiaris]|uniref:melanoma-associated antigen B4-like isoform X1 n=1 Tax=Canis lupus familiaris TaxID=9615 RepID=UPI0018F76BF0|nr:melanoma-associated antigen B4-like isoform X1 [Canis lupus familiaris]
MPRGQKSKLRARKKRHEGHGEESVGVAAAAAAVAEVEGSPPRAPEAAAAPPPQPGSPGASASASGSPREQGAGSPAGSPGPSARRDPLSRKASMLVQLLLEKHSSGEPVPRAALQKTVGRKYREHFPEIFRCAAERLELVFGLELREVDARSQSYALVSKLGLAAAATSTRELPKTGLLMTLLGVIFMKGNRAAEEDIWEFLHMLGVYEGRWHLIFGEPRKLLTQDLVRQGYLEYRQVPASDPPRHEFLWGPRARAETSKMQVLQVLAKINDTVPSCFPELYAEALLDQEERAGPRASARGASATATARAASAMGASAAATTATVRGASAAAASAWGASAAATTATARWALASARGASAAAAAATATAWPPALEAALGFLRLQGGARGGGGSSSGLQRGGRSTF